MRYNCQCNKSILRTFLGNISCESTDQCGPTSFICSHWAYFSWEPAHSEYHFQCLSLTAAVTRRETFPLGLSSIHRSKTSCREDELQLSCGVKPGKNKRERCFSFRVLSYSRTRENKICKLKRDISSGEKEPTQLTSVAMIHSSFSSDMT